MEKNVIEIVRELLNEPSELVIEEIAEMVEEHCGEKPEFEYVRRVWRESAVPQTVTPVIVQPGTKQTKQKIKRTGQQKTKVDTYNKKPFSVKIEREEFSVNHWKDVIISVGNWLVDKKVTLPINIKWGNKRILIGSVSSKNNMHTPKKLKNGLYIETNYSSVGILKLSQRLLKHCGYNYKILEVKYQ
ncbi:MAG: hypothetical protein ABIH42_01195 [Planctomycetota bacterium]